MHQEYKYQNKCYWYGEYGNDAVHGTLDRGRKQIRHSRTSSTPTTIFPRSLTSSHIHNGFHIRPATTNKPQKTMLCHAPAAAMRARARDGRDKREEEGRATNAEGIRTVSETPREVRGRESLRLRKR